MSKQKVNGQGTNRQEVKSSGSVTIANGTGNEPIKVDYYQGDTVTTILERAELELEEDATVSLGRKRIDKDKLDSTTVVAGDTLVIAGKVCNG